MCCFREEGDEWAGSCNHSNSVRCSTTGCPRSPQKSGIISTHSVTKNRSHTHTHTVGLLQLHVQHPSRGRLNRRRGSAAEWALTYIRCRSPAAQPSVARRVVCVWKRNCVSVVLVTSWRQKSVQCSCVVSGIRVGIKIQSQRGQAFTVDSLLSSCQMYLYIYSTYR